MITLISGTNRPNSLTSKFSKIYYGMLQERHSETKYFDLESLPEEVLHTDVYEKGKKPDAILQIQHEIFRPTEKFIFVFPEYNGSFPGILKLLIDVMDPRIAFSGKKAALVGISTGRAGNLRGMDHFASVMNHMNVHVLPFLLPISGVQNEMDQNAFKDATEKLVNHQLSQILAF